MPGRKTLVALVLAILVPSPTPAVAQVINGESNYEDNFLHAPPPDTPDDTRSAPTTQRPTTGADQQPSAPR